MARLEEIKVEDKLKAVEEWRDRCLLADASVFLDEPIWTLEHLDELVQYFIQNYLDDERSFYDKLEEQLLPASSGAKALAAEMLWFMLLFPTKISLEKKRDSILQVWRWSGKEIDSHHPYLNEVLDPGVGSAGQSYNVHRWRELTFFIRLMQAWKRLKQDRRESLAVDPWALNDWVYEIEDPGHRQFQNIFLYLLFPDYFERMATDRHKREAVRAFADSLPGKERWEEIKKAPVSELNKALYDIRQELELKYPDQQLDFYKKPLRSQWIDKHDDLPSAETTDDQLQPKNVWIEKSIVKGRLDRQSGSLCVGKALWSPQTDKGGKRIYKEMTEVQVGDIILHLTDNEAISGVSLVAERVDDTFICAPDTNWADKLGYLIELSDFIELEPKLHRTEFLESSKFGARLDDIAGRYRRLFYNKSRELNQGAYLTAVPSELVGLLDEAYLDHTGKHLPYIEELELPSIKSHWIFQANPRLYNIDSALRELSEMSWSARQHAAKIRPGDSAYIWRSGKEAGIVAELVITMGAAKRDATPEDHRFTKDPKALPVSDTRVLGTVLKVIEPPLLRERLVREPGLESLSILKYNQGTNFAVTPDEASIIDRLLATEGTPTAPRYTVEDFSNESGFTKVEIDGWLARLDRKKHIVLQGPSGTGKTFVAQRLARCMVSDTSGYSDIVQFHPSYAYEDFIQGIRPDVTDGKLAFKLTAGRFLDFCEKAQVRPNVPCVLIIDEINRANLSRVFGELMYLLEYRDGEIPLATAGTRFKIPDNVYIVGTMNTADRSIALVDHALRRRFSFIFLGPKYDLLEKRLSDWNLPSKSLVRALRDVNTAIGDRHYEVGISFFLADGDQLQKALPVIWSGEIEPYLEEYFFDQPGKVDEFRWEKLKATTLTDWT